MCGVYLWHCTRGKVEDLMMGEVELLGKVKGWESLNRLNWTAVESVTLQGWPPCHPTIQPYFLTGFVADKHKQVFFQSSRPLLLNAPKESPVLHVESSYGWPGFSDPMWTCHGLGPIGARQAIAPPTHPGDMCLALASVPIYPCPDLSLIW